MRFPIHERRSAFSLIPGSISPRERSARGGAGLSHRSGRTNNPGREAGQELWRDRTTGGWNDKTEAEIHNPFRPEPPPLPARTECGHEARTMRDFCKTFVDPNCEKLVFR